MSKQSLLPTPAPSSEIQPHSLAAIDSLSLPPAALTTDASTRNSSITSNAQSPPLTYSPVSPPPSIPPRTKQAAGSKRKSSAVDSLQQEYVLPPPPTRSRKIIQMKPRQPSKDEPAAMSPNGREKLRSGQTIAPAPTAAPKNSAPMPAAGSKRKQAPGPATAAGRKMARKTAHSLIERRRRSKMNEEFGVLKDMIPACAGQEMHKLAILQASIQYMRYLEKCLADLKSAHEQCPRQGAKAGPSTHHSITAPPSEDLPPLRQAIPNHRLPSISPALLPSTHGSAHASPQHGPLPSYHGTPLLAGLPSPALGPTGGRHRSLHGSFSLASPSASAPSPELQMPEDREATAALLMLNTDRRSWAGERRDGEQRQARAGRGMSVLEMLS